MKDNLFRLYWVALLLWIVIYAYEGCEIICRNALGLERNNLCNKSSLWRFHRDSEITWKQFSFIIIIIIIFPARKGENFCILPVIINNPSFQDSILKKSEVTLFKSIPWSNLLPSEHRILLFNLCFCFKVVLASL